MLATQRSIFGNDGGKLLSIGHAAKLTLKRCAKKDFRRGGSYPPPEVCHGKKPFDSKL